MIKPKKINLIGNLLFITGFVIFIFTFLPVFVQEIKYKTTPPTSDYKLVETQQEADEVRAEPVFEKTTIIPKSFDFSLVIPSIGVNSLVFSNIDSGNPDVYLPVLKKGVAHATGSSLPDKPGPVFIFAHSTDNFYNISQYNAVFFLLNKLQPGDDTFVFYNQRKFRYQVIDKKVVSPEDIPGLVASTKENVLILQTCYPPGTTIKRLLVLAKLI